MTRQVNTGTRESFSHPLSRPGVWGEGGKRGRGGGARLRVNERSDTKIRSDRAGIRPPDGGAGPVSRWIARCSPLPPPETKLLRVTTRHRALVRPTDEETSDERRGTVGNREMGRTDPWNGSWRKCFRSSTLGIGPTSCPIRTPPPPRPREIREVYEGFVTSSNWIVAMDTCILEMEIWDFFFYFFDVIDV